MALFNSVKLADFVYKFYRNDFKSMTPYKFVPQKEEFIPEENISSKLPRSIPENQGVSSAHLEAFLRELSAAKEANVHSVVILRHGRVITDAHFSPYRGDYPHTLYSMSKSIVSTAVGIAIAEGLFTLEDKIVDIFPEDVNRFHDSRLDDIRVRHLLIMSSGINFNEFSSFLNDNWTAKFLQSDMAFAPGEKFSYNSLNTYLLSAIICKKSGMGLMEYITPRLFEPLQIKGAYWEKCPNGIEKGGWGLSLRAEDMAKIGQLYLQKGKWIVDGEEKQILPKEWIEESVKHRIETDREGSKYYGYQIWSFPIDTAYQFNGMFGQYVIVIPKHDIVLAITSGGQNLFPKGSTLDIVQRYFSSDNLFSDEPIRINKAAVESYNFTVKNLAFRRVPPVLRRESIFSHIRKILFSAKSKPDSLTHQEIKYTAREYDIKKVKMSVLPFLIQFVHGNFTDGVEKVRFKFNTDKYEIDITEEGKTNKLVVGRGDEPLYCNVNINGEIYTVGSTAQWCTDEDDNDVLKVYISFIETPDTRIFKFIFKEDNLTIKFEELPSINFATKVLSSVLKRQAKGGAILGLDSILSEEKIIEKVGTIITPITEGTLIK